MNALRRTLVGCSLLLWAACPGQVYSQIFFWPIGVTVTKTAIGAPNNFDLAVGPPAGGSLIAPDGTVLQIGNGANVISGLSQAELTTRFAGQWTINDVLNLPPGAPQQHQFNVSSSALTSGFPQIPTVVSPDEGAVVPRVFEVQWQDNDRSGGGFRIMGLGQIDRVRLGDDHYQFTAAFQPGEREKAITFFANSSTITHLPDAAPITANPIRRFYPLVQRITESLPRHFTVAVPEPAASYSLFVGIVFLYGANRHGSRSTAMRMNR